MTKLNSDEPVMLTHKTRAMEQKLFFPGDDVPDEWAIPDRLLEGAEAEGGEGNEADSGDGDGDDDDLDEGDDGEPVTEGGGSTEPQLDETPSLDDLDVGASSVAGLTDAVMALPEDERAAAAQRIIDEESRRPSPRATLLTAMRKLLPS